MSPTVQSISALTPRVIAAIMLIAMMAHLGLALEPVTDRAEKRRVRRLVVWALAFNFALVPLMALAAQRATGATGPLAIALLLLAACPGGRHAPALARAGGGDAELSVEITLFMNKLNVFLSPLLAAWLIGGQHVGLRELPFVAQLFVLQVVPYFGARRLRRKRPELATRLARPAQHTARVAALALLLYLALHHVLRSTLSFGARGWLAVLLFGAMLLVSGWLVGGRDPATRRTFAVASEARNLALALVIANMTGHDERVLLALFGAWVILVALGWLAAALLRTKRLPTIPLGTSGEALPAH
jgi:BASS family bile acid:Na+ symporter